MAVVGGGDSAVEEGMFLTKFADKVYLVHRRDELRAAKIAQERAFANPKMEFVWDSVPRRIAGDQLVEALDVQNVKTQEVRTLPVNGVFFYIGQVANTAFLQGVVQRDEAGYIVTDDLMRTSLCGVFACGDARSNPLKQIAMAVGDGALAAVQAQRYLDELECPAPGTAAGAARRQRPRRDRRRRRHPDADERSTTWTLSHRTTSRTWWSRPRARSWSTSGPSGAARAAWSARSSTSWPATTPTSPS